MKRLIPVLLIVLVLPLWISCGDDKGKPATEGTKSKAEGAQEEQEVTMFPHIPHYDLKLKLRKYAKVDLEVDETILSEPEKEALAKIVQAGRVMDDIFLRQVWSGNVAMQNELHALHMYTHDRPFTKLGESHDMVWDFIRFYNINMGPWDRLVEDEPFIGDLSRAKPQGANFYPEDMTKEEFDTLLAQHPDKAEAFKGYFTVIRRQGGGLVAIPYSTEYQDLLDRAAALMREAADILSAPENTAKLPRGVDYTTLATFLKSRADAFASNSYRQSDMDWMDVKDNIIDLTIGPYEVYEDAIFGYKASFEAFVALRNPADSKKLDGIKRYLPKLEASLPIPSEHKNPNRGSESPVSVVDLVYSAGDTKAGVQTIAFNLPNDEAVREAKGSKKVMLKNISQAKFDKILVPIAAKVLDPSQMDRVVFDAYFSNTLMHEISHGLGPGTIKVKDGTESTVNRELKELYSFLEEAKADILGLYCTRMLVKEGFFSKDMETNGYVCFLPGFFRAIRFGATSAHGGANMMEFNFLKEQGAIEYDAAMQKFRVHIDKMPAAVEAMANELLMIQALGDYEGAKAFKEKYSQSSPELETLLASLADIPTDIEPMFGAEAYLDEAQRRHTHRRAAPADHDHEHSH
jgi:hypothetical protein